MDVKKLIRSPEKVKACLKELPDRRLVAIKPVKIHIPSRFAERNLASLGHENYIVGIYGMIVEDTYYASSMVNAMMRIEPSSMMRVMIDETEYLEFSFDAGATVFSSVDLVKNKPLVYRIYDELIAKGRVPWYLGYLQMGAIFKTARRHAGANIGGNQEVTELVVSSLARLENDRTKTFRSVVKSLEELDRKPPVFIPLRSVQYASTSTLNKLAGSYFQEGVVSALVSPSERSERIDVLLRS